MRSHAPWATLVLRWAECGAGGIQYAATAGQPGRVQAAADQVVATRRADDRPDARVLQQLWEAVLR
jgi:hypothetical protein